MACIRAKIDKKEDVCIRIVTEQCHHWCQHNLLEVLAPPTHVELNVHVALLELVGRSPELMIRGAAVDMHERRK